MEMTQVLGQDFLKNYLLTTAKSGRIPHAQLFTGKPGSGALPLALAYARHLIIQTAGEGAAIKLDQYNHPDLHFIYPTITTDEVKSKPKSTDFLISWREFILENPYANLFDWYKKLGHLNKQGEIRVEDAQEALKTLSLKSYEGGYKILIIWQADKMNIATSNKLLKLIEEPPLKTVILLVSEYPEDILDTIKSRCQKIELHALGDTLIAQELIKRYAVEQAKAHKIAHQAQGDYNKALSLLHQTNDYPFDQWFVTWVRTAFRAKTDGSAINGLLSWSETIAASGKETQKEFLYHCIETFRQALLLNYQAPQLVYLEPEVENFKLEKFAPFVNGNNIHEIYKELSDAIYHIERNGNSKLILTDLSIKLTRLIHKT